MATTITGHYWEGISVNNPSISLGNQFSFDKLPLIEVSRSLTNIYAVNWDAQLGELVLGRTPGHGIWIVEDFEESNDTNSVYIVTNCEVEENRAFTLSYYNSDGYIQKGALIYINKAESKVFKVFDPYSFSDTHTYGDSDWIIDEDNNEAYIKQVETSSQIAHFDGTTLTLGIQGLLEDDGNAELVKCDYSLTYTISEPEDEEYLYTLTFTTDDDYYFESVDITSTKEFITITLSEYGEKFEGYKTTTPSELEVVSIYTPIVDELDFYQSDITLTYDDHSGWKDDYGDTYSLDEEYDVNSDVIFKALWDTKTKEQTFTLPIPPSIDGYDFVHYKYYDIGTEENITGKPGDVIKLDSQYNEDNIFPITAIYNTMPTVIFKDEISGVEKSITISSGKTISLEEQAFDSYETKINNLDLVCIIDDSGNLINQLESIITTTGEQSGWDDSYGDFYSLAESYTVEANETFIAVWDEIVTISFTLPDSPIDVKYKYNNSTYLPGQTVIINDYDYNPIELEMISNSEEEIYYHQTVKVKYQQPDGSWSEEETVIDDDYLAGDIVSWSRETDAKYQYASISYTVEKEETKIVYIYRNISYLCYDGNGGNSIPTTQSALYGATTTISSIIPTKYGYNFLGWSSGSSLYQPGISIILKGTITITAKWEKIPEVERVDQEIYLYKNGNCYAKEFIEEENIGFGIGGEIYNLCFNEIDYSGNYEISNTKFIALSFIEGLPEQEKGE